MMKLQDLLKDIEIGKVYTDKDRKPFKVNEDGHTDVASAERKLKLIMKDAMDTLNALRSLSNENSLPSWWTDKITLAKDLKKLYKDTVTKFMREMIKLRKKMK